MGILAIFAVIAVWLLIVHVLTDDTPDKPLKGMSNPILFEEMRDKHSKK